MDLDDMSIKPPSPMLPEPPPEPAHTPGKSTLRVEITPFTMLFALFLAGVVWTLGKLIPVLLVLICSLMVVGTVNPLVQALERRGIGRGKGIAMVFVTLLLLVAAALLLTIPALISQVTDLIEHESVLREQLAAYLANYRFTEPLADGLRNIHYTELLKESRAELFNASKNLIEIVAYGAAAFFLALYIMIDGDRLRGALFAVVPRSYHMQLSRILLNLQTIVGGYLRGQALTCLFMGLFIFVLLTACGIPNALAFAAFGAIADVLPFLGIVLTMVPAVLAALAKGQTAAIIVFTLLLAYEEFESRILIPMVYGRALRLPSSVVFFALLVGGTLYGIMGALLALPMAATIFMIIEELRVSLPGESPDVESVEKLEKDAHAVAEYERRTEGLPAEQAAAIALSISDNRQKEEETDQHENPAR
jgi:predicted PurR-regulated permease PerM